MKTATILILFSFSIFCKSKNAKIIKIKKLDFSTNGTINSVKRSDDNTHNSNDEQVSDTLSVLERLQEKVRASKSGDPAKDVSSLPEKDLAKIKLMLKNITKIFDKIELHGKAKAKKKDGETFKKYVPISEDIRDPELAQHQELPSNIIKEGNEAFWIGMRKSYKN